jgi:hypothetical protein
MDKRETQEMKRKETQITYTFGTQPNVGWHQFGATPLTTPVVAIIIITVPARAQAQQRLC